MPRKTLILVLVVAGFAGALVGSLIFAVGHSAYEIAVGEAGVEMLAVLLIAPIYGISYGAWLGAPFALLLVTPTHIALVRSGATSWICYAAAGPVVGALAASLFFSGVALIYGDSYPNAFRDFVMTLPMACIMGLAACVLFWLIRRPDRDPSPSVIPDSAER